MATRTTVYQLRLTPSEKKLIQHSAKQAGLPVSTWMRLVLFRSNMETLVDDLSDRRKQRAKK
jgi:uncharacterized protein (DUF1778 family)